ncbi:ATP synthase subunit gamma, mitochondrial, partial [Goodea atripinnis]
LKPARVYGTGALALYEKADIKAPEEKAAKHLIVGVTSDRGLCGAIHSGVAKTIKSEIANLTGAGKEVMVINVGDKLRGLLYRTHGNHILLNCKEVGRKPPNFGDASIIAAELLNSGYEFDQGSIIFNRFRYHAVSAFGPVQKELQISTERFVVDADPRESHVLIVSRFLTENMGIYDDIDADILRNYQEFALVNIIYLALKESSTSEQSARMTAMDSASKNACKTLLNTGPDMKSCLIFTPVYSYKTKELCCFC